MVTEPFSEWVLSGAFPAGRPRWEDAGATFTDDIAPFEQRKLWLLNGGHSLLAYAGSRPRPRDGRRRRGRRDVPRVAASSGGTEASRHLSLPADGRRGATARRCSSASRTPGCATGSPRSPPTARRSSRSGSCRCCAPSAAAGPACPEGAVRVLAAWIGHLRGAGAPVVDPRADELVALAAGPLPEAVRRVLDDLDPRWPRTTTSSRPCCKPHNSSTSRAGHDRATWPPSCRYIAIRQYRLLEPQPGWQVQDSS